MSTRSKTIVAIVALMQLAVGNAFAEIHSVVLDLAPSTQLELTGSALTSDTTP